MNIKDTFKEYMINFPEGWNKRRELKCFTENRHFIVNSKQTS